MFTRAGARVTGTSFGCSGRASGGRGGSGGGWYRALEGNLLNGPKPKRRQRRLFFSSSSSSLLELMLTKRRRPTDFLLPSSFVKKRKCNRSWVIAKVWCFVTDNKCLVTRGPKRVGLRPKSEISLNVTKAPALKWPRPSRRSWWRVARMDRTVRQAPVAVNTGP